MWVNMCRHVREVEDQLWEKDGVIIKFGQDSDDDDCSDDEPEDDYAGNNNDDSDDLFDDGDDELLHQETKLPYKMMYTQ